MSGQRAIQVQTPAESQQMLLGVLNGEVGSARDIVLLNTGVALYAANVADSMEAGLKLATQTLDSGAPVQVLERWRAFCQTQ